MVAGGMAGSRTKRVLIIPAVFAAVHQHWKGGCDGICNSPVQGGGPASDIAEDVVLNYRWYQHISGWTTTPGINTTLVLNDP